MADQDHSVDEEQVADDEAAEELGCTALVQIRWSEKMSESDRLDVANWLRGVADGLLAEGHNYASLFTARLDPED
jgi:hypothetical protein